MKRGCPSAMSDGWNVIFTLRGHSPRKVRHAPLFLKEHAMPITYHYAADAANEPMLTTRAHPAWRESRQRADGLLDLSRIACETGFRAPVAISDEALACCLAGLPELRPGRFPSHDAA